MSRLVAAYGLILTLLLLVVTALCRMPPVAACPACVGTTLARLTLVQRFADSDQVVLALPTEHGGVFEVVRVIKGNDSSVMAHLKLSLDQLPQGPVPLNQNVILARSSLGERWSFVGEISEGRDEWLRKIAGMKRTRELSESDWEQRVAEFLPLLNEDDALMRETAFLEMARAPYSAMRTLKPVLATKSLMALYQDPRNEEHRPLLIVLMGIVGGEELRLLINGRVQENLMRHQTVSMSALLVALLEMAGPEAGSLIFEKYIADDSRTLEEAKSAVVALSVHGNANTLVSRDAVISLYRDLLTRWPALAASLVPDLVAWECWDFEPQMRRAVSLVQPTDEGAIEVDKYLQACRKHRQ
jgi:hypothetical protein